MLFGATSLVNALRIKKVIRKQHYISCCAIHPSVSETRLQRRALDTGERPGHMGEPGSILWTKASETQEGDPAVKKAIVCCDCATKVQDNHLLVAMK